MNNSQTFKHIGIGVAFSPNLKANLAEALRLAISLNAHITLIHVGEQSADKRQDLIDALPQVNREKAQWDLVFEPGNPVETILNVAQRLQIDLLLLGALKQEGFLKYYVGSIARKITKKAKCSVLLMINPTEEQSSCEHIVVNGLNTTGTDRTIKTAFEVAHRLNSDLITIVDELDEKEIKIKAEDSKTLRKSSILKQKLEIREHQRIKKVVEEINDVFKQNIKIVYQHIFGKRGYSIGHYAEIARADLLVMNAPLKSNFIHKFFPHDMDYILNELPTDVLIVR